MTESSPSPENRPPRSSTLPAAVAGPPTQSPAEPDAGDAPEPEDEPRRWSRRALLGTALLIALFVAAGLFAAWTVTPGPDEEALARPSGADLVIAGVTPLSWDPAVTSDSGSAQVQAQVYAGLTALDSKAMVRPALAESWAIEDDGQRITFELRPDLTFSDGTPLAAEDVRRSWLRVIDPARPSPLSSLLDDVAGAAAYARGEGDVDAVGLHAEGRTLTVEFERPASYFLAVAAGPTLAVSSSQIEHLADGPEDDEPFPASGAYVPVDQELGQIQLEANDAYWAGTPAIEQVTIITDDGGRSSVDVFEDGAVDWTRISSADASWIRYDRNLGPQLRQGDEMAVQYLGFDTTEPPFDDPAARRAVAMAVDWRRLAEMEDAEGAPPTSLVPPGVAGRGHDDYLLPHDPDAARAELVAAGYPDGVGFPAVSLATYGIGPTEAIATDLERELGIDVRLERRPFGEHTLLLDADPPAMWTLGWSADYPHAHDFLGLLLKSDSSANLGGWNEPAFDELIDEAAATGDSAEQERLYASAQALVETQVPVIPLGYGDSWWLSREGLLGGDVSGVGIVDLAQMAWSE